MNLKVNPFDTLRTKVQSLLRVDPEQAVIGNLVPKGGVWSRSRRIKLSFVVGLAFVCIMVFSYAKLRNANSTEVSGMENELRNFIKDYESKVVPLRKSVAISYFDATITGDPLLYKKKEELDIKLSKIHSNKGDFAKLKRFKESKEIKDPLLKRQLDIIYNTFLEKQIDEKLLEDIIRLETDIEKRYATYRASIDGKELTDNVIEDILGQEIKSERLKDAWTASKQVGKLVAADVLKLVKMRNEAARKLGFPNYHTLSLSLGEQDPKEIENLFNELDKLTRKTFINLKTDIDEFLAKRYGTSKENLMPWHYQNRFFQEAPKIYNVDLDKYYKGKNLAKITEDYYAKIGLPISDLIRKSDLYEKPNKYQHAYCIDVDKEGDVRVVCNIKPDYKWMNTSLHEFGHAVYDKFNDRDMPWVLREPAHTFTTEAIAMLFGRFASNPAWLKDVIGISDEEKNKINDECFKSLRLEQLVFSRWAQVMYRFEKSMYENPDQDLNKLWWDMVEKYQMLKRPENRNEPDWAAKIHVALYPAYYHNYLMGELLASQLYYYIAKNVLKTDDIFSQSFEGNKEVGDFLREKVFKPGSLHQWNDMIKKATGEKLTAKYYAKQFVK